MEDHRARGVPAEATQPRLPYNLIGHNCEIIANMCSCGSWTESYQTRKFFLARTAMDIPLMLFMATRSRAKLPLPRWVYPVAVAGFVSTVFVMHTYNGRIKQFWQENRQDWQAHERTLGEDPATANSTNGRIEPLLPVAPRSHRYPGRQTAG